MKTALLLLASFSGSQAEQNIKYLDANFDHDGYMTVELIINGSSRRYRPSMTDSGLTVPRDLVKSPRLSFGSSSAQYVYHDSANERLEYTLPVQRTSLFQKTVNKPRRRKTPILGTLGLGFRTGKGNMKGVPSFIQHVMGTLTNVYLTPRNDTPQNRLMIHHMPLEDRIYFDFTSKSKYELDLGRFEYKPQNESPTVSLGSIKMLVTLHTPVTVLPHSLVKLLKEQSGVDFKKDFECAEGNERDLAIIFGELSIHIFMNKHLIKKEKENMCALKNLKEGKRNTITLGSDDAIGNGVSFKYTLSGEYNAIGFRQSSENTTSIHVKAKNPVRKSGASNKRKKSE